MSETPKLEPCPFFGEDPFQPIYDDVTEHHFVICDECQCEGPATKTEAEAIAAWNRRALTSRSDALEEAEIKLVAYRNSRCAPTDEAAAEFQTAIDIIRALKKDQNNG